jgi:hypothetical protein
MVAFVFAWLNVAAQPCLIAMDMTAETERVSMPMEHGDHHGSHVSAEDAELAHDCGHCPPSGSAAHQSNCATMQATDCTELPQSNIDVRSQKTEFNDTSGTFAVAQAPPKVEIPRSSRLAMARTCARLKFTDSPPLNLRYCVFLK